jgi:hypothetical protein
MSARKTLELNPAHAIIRDAERLARDMEAFAAFYRLRMDERTATP